MQTVTIKKSILLQKVAENKAKHINDFNKSLEGYKVQARAKVFEFEKLACAAIDEGRPLPYFQTLVFPTSHVEDYDRVLEMAEMSIDKNISLTQEEFKNYIQDNWAWKQTFDMVNSTYLNK